MDRVELEEIIKRGEDSLHQFKSDVTSEISIAREMIAFSNALGGKIIIGVSDNGSVSGLARSDIGRLSNLVSNAASQHVRPAINPLTENISHADGLVMVVHVSPGISKPYMDKDGVVWIKSGPDKRKATSREEIQRMYQSSGLIHGDAVLAGGMTIKDLDIREFERFYEKQYEETLNLQELPLEQLMENLNLSRDGFLNVAGALLFGKYTAFRLPAFIVKCVAYPGNDIHLDDYYDSQDISGVIRTVFDDTVAFILRHLRRVQQNQNVNSLGKLEIPKIVIEELVANALIHRDYFISASVRIFVFSDRIEIVSPGHLPNNLTIENIKRGNSNIRNPILASFATKLLPYRGLGNGIIRAVKAFPDIEFVDDRDGNLFKCIIKRCHKLPYC
ncbi:RNA-binding domain-containing protein [Desulfamplus magnetovallimortis]|nr:RNA-binding domain-containing protein [Desulfamplus magnetovallimortis]